MKPIPLKRVRVGSKFLWKENDLTWHEATLDLIEILGEVFVYTAEWNWTISSEQYKNLYEK